MTLNKIKKTETKKMHDNWQTWDLRPKNEKEPRRMLADLEVQNDFLLDTQDFTQLKAWDQYISSIEYEMHECGFCYPAYWRLCPTFTSQDFGVWYIIIIFCSLKNP